MAVGTGARRHDIGLRVAHAPEEAFPSESSLSTAAASCPALATACPRGCFALEAHPVDPRKGCLLARQAFGCSPFETTGPPAVTCSVSPDETIWISFEARLHPQGRHCTAAEQQAIAYPRCS